MNAHRRPRIVSTAWIHNAALDRLSELGDIDCNRAREPWSRDELRSRAADAHGLLAFMTDAIDRDFLAICPRLKVIACALRGYDNFDVQACSEAGVWLSTVPDLLANPTAELAVGLAIGLGRRIREGDSVVRSGGFAGWRPELYGLGFDGSKVAVLGMGQVGRALCQRLRGFGCHIVGVDRCGDMPAGVERLELDVALAEADFVFVALPLTGHTRHLVGRAALAAMKPHALLINVGRGSVVDEVAVAEGLELGRLGGYAADVFEMEDWALPDRPRAIDSRLLAHPCTLFTPHLGSAVDNVRLAMTLRAIENIADVLEGRRPRDAVNEPLRMTAMA